jgi:glycosyltransferase involved in cell wall biosynthesis
MKVAIVHDWFVGGGAERVVYELHKMYPDAPIYTAYCSPEWQQRLAPAKVITSYMQHWPFSKLRKFLPPLRAIWFSRLELEDYDLVISSSGAEAKGIRVKPPAVHINYCHAPTHYYWNRYDEYMKNPGFGVLNPLARLGLKVLVGPMRHWDYKAAQRPGHMIANSNFTKDQIKKYYGRDSDVIFPPVDIEKFQAGSGARNNFLVIGRQTPYKRIDLAIAACTQLKLPLIVIGNGPEHKKLVKMAGPTIKFLVGQPDDEVARQLQLAKAFFFPGLDDFGISAVEALAAGTPVIAYKAGGALDYLKPGVNGLFIDKQDVDSLTTVLTNFSSSNFDPLLVRKTALPFIPQEFARKLKAYIQTIVQL